MPEQESDFQIGDVESYSSGKDQAFSHQALVMQTMKKCVEYGTMEQTQGVFISEKDMKGNTKVIYRQDVRKAFIESVRTAKMIMICDFDITAKEKIPALIEKINKRKKDIIKEQWGWYNKLSQSQKNSYIQRGVIITQDSFSTDLPFFQSYLFEELEVYRKILEELTLLTERLDFYKEEDFEA